jgi:acetoacetyl-CoA synthetase
MACGAIGAIFSATSPDMGADGIVDRYSQLRPKLLFVETRLVYAGKTLDLRSRMQDAVEKIEKMVPELEQTIVINGPMFSGSRV